MSGRRFEVWLENELTGALFEDEHGRISFRFVDGYLKLPKRPILGQAFEDDLRRAYGGRRAGELPAFFANLLPEGRLRRIIERSMELSEGDDLGLLAAAAEDLPGAITLRKSEELQLLPEDTEPRRNGDHDGRSEVQFRFSLAGVQLKFSVVRDGEKLALSAHGNRGDWIVKVGSDEFPGLSENEFSMLEWAKSSGFEVPETELLDVGAVPQIAEFVPKESTLLAVKRFDRAGGRRIHQEDFMQVLGRSPRGDQKYGSSYEELAQIVFALFGDEGYEELVRRLALVLATGNNDAHLKNWSLLYVDPGQAALSPLYDQVATVAWPKLDRELALKLAGAREFARVSGESFRRLGRKVGVDPERSLEIARETLKNLQTAWPSVMKRQILREDHARALVDHWTRVPLLREVGVLG